MQHSFRRKAFICRMVFGRLFAARHKNFVRAAREIAALFGERRPAFAHLVPGAAQGVIDKKLDYITRCEELITKGHLIRVAGRGAFFASLIAQFLWREILIDPADGLVLDPNIF
ncbi:MAG: hypothetical protein L0229_26220 [Blastocatellia bacterium]|nr:hypothetical protein [Blastocatellia bacterium]